MIGRYEEGFEEWRDSIVEKMVLGIPLIVMMDVEFQ